MKKILILSIVLLTSCGYDDTYVDNQDNVVTSIDGTDHLYDIITVKNKNYGKFKMYVKRNTYRIGDTLVIELKSNCRIKETDITVH